MTAPRPRPAPLADQGPPSLDAWARLRWHDLVDSLVAEGLAPDGARRGVAEGLERLRPGWRSLVTRRDLDVEAWQEVRAAVGLPPRPGEVAPMVGAPRESAPDPFDRPDPWLVAARSSDRGHTLRVVLVLLAGLVVAAAAVTWWVSRPDPPPVRGADNVLPVPWYDGAELHLERWTVTLPAPGGFAVTDDGTVATRVTNGPVWLVAPDGRVTGGEPGDVPAADPLPVPESLTLMPDDRVVQSVTGPGATTVHVVSSRVRVESGGFTRGSETGRRAVIVCADQRCAPPSMPAGAGEVRLR